jgi:hypothetical protein
MRRPRHDMKIRDRETDGGDKKSSAESKRLLLLQRI